MATNLPGSALATARRLRKQAVTSAVDRVGGALANNAKARFLFFAAARHFTPVVLADSDVGKFYVNTSDRTIGLHAFQYGGWEVKLMREVFQTVRDRGFRDLPGKLILDVGANIGTICISTVLEGHVGGAIAVEPEPSNLCLLGQNIRANGIEDRVRVIDVALSAGTGQAQLELATSNLGDHRIRSAGASASAGPDLLDEGVRELITVETVSFDELVACGDIVLDRLALVWVDVQGHEGDIFRGATSLLESDVPLFVEFWPYGLKRAGGLRVFEEAVSEHYTEAIALGGTLPDLDGVIPSTQVGELGRMYEGLEHTNLLLLKR